LEGFDYMLRRSLDQVKRQWHRESGTSIVAPAASVITALVIVVAYAGSASPLVVLITFAAS
jgi:hypothetical protein